MIKLTVLYGHPADSTAFDKHYAEVHTPLVDKLPGLVRFEEAKVIGTPTGGKPEYYLIAELWFNNMEEFQAGMGILSKSRGGRYTEATESGPDGA